MTGIKSKTQRKFLKIQNKISAERQADLRIIQQSTIDNRFVQSQAEWEAAADSLAAALGRDKVARWEKVANLAGPVWYQQYWNWSARTDEQFNWDRTKRVLAKVAKNYIL